MDTWVLLQKRTRPAPFSGELNGSFHFLFGLRFLFSARADLFQKRQCRHRLQDIAVDDAMALGIDQFP